MKPKKILIPELSDKEVVLRCTHERLWPPPLMKLDVNIEAMWSAGDISQHDYQQIETWKRVCGKMEIGGKCVTCPLAKVEQPRLGHEHHGHKDIVPLGDALRKETTKRNMATKTQSAPEPAPEPKPEPAAEGEPAAESFDAEPESFVDDTVNVTEPDYPIGEGDGNGEAEAFEQPPEPEAEPEPENTPPDDSEEVLDALLDED